MKQKIKIILALLILIVTTIIGFWLAIKVLLVGGIMQTMMGLQFADANMAAWGIIRALLFEMGFFPIWIGIFIAGLLTD